MRQIGDKVWISWVTAHSRRKVPCPVCFGRKEVHIINGEGDTFAIQCDACTHGLGSKPSGVATERYAEAGVTHAEVCGVERNSRGEFEYRYSPHCYDQIGVFETEAEAQKAADEALPAAMEERAKIEAGIVRDRWSRATWSLRYHQDAIRKSEREVAFHRDQIRLLKESAEEEA